MKIQIRILAALCCLFLTAQMATAQKNMWVLSNTKKAYGIPVSSIKYATFNDNSWFKFGTTQNQVPSDTSICDTWTASIDVNSGVKSLAVTPEIGICYSSLNTTPTVDDSCQVVDSVITNTDGDYSFTLSGLSSCTTYYYRLYIKVADAVYYSDVREAKTLGPKIIDGHKFIDLGLPSGLLWAETNVGAATAADDGNYYAWGETAPKTNYSWDTYLYRNDKPVITKYTSTDGKTVLENTDDAAYMNWGSYCRMPTKEDFEELLDTVNCTWTLDKTSMTNSSGKVIRGYKVISKKNGASIFIPCSGYYSGTKLLGNDSFAAYWSSTACVVKEGSGEAYYFIGSVSELYIDSNLRSYGRTVRPVANP